MKSEDDERKPFQQLLDDRQQVRLADLLASGDQLELRHTIHRIDVINPLHPILIALMHAVYPDVARHAIGLGGAAASDGDAAWPRLGPVSACILVLFPAAQVV